MDFVPEMTTERLGQAAVLFDQAAEMVGGLAQRAERLEPESILHGGSLAVRVPERIAESVVVALQCRIEIEAAADTCRRRQTELDLYEQDMAQYEADLVVFEADMARWQSSYMAWLMDREYVLPHPGDQPVAPMAPTPPHWLV